MDPFTLAMMAIGTVKSGIAMYKEAKSIGKEAMGVISEISSGLSNFFEHQEKAIAYDEEKKKNPPKNKSIQAIALENVIRKKQLQQAEYDLRQMLVYESPPELGAIYDEFIAERAKLLKDKAHYDAAQKKRIANMSWNTKPEILRLHYALQSWWYSLP